MQIYAPDTNFFLQCDPADQIEWGLVTAEEEVVLLVVREVRKELDRLKSGGNQRRAKRARATSALLRRFISEEIHEIELRTANPRVLLRVAPRSAADSYPSGYRIDSADERVVADVYAAGVAIGEQITFLSHDTVPLEDAVELGIQIRVVPEEWLLDPEPSNAERELNDVKRRMKVLEGRSPNIVVELPVDERGCINLSSPYFPPLSERFIATVMREVGRRHAIGPDENTPFRIGSVLAALEGVDEARWAKYTQEHAAWLQEVKDRLHDMARFMNEDPNAIKLPFSVANTGNVGADNLIVRIEACGGFHLVDPDAQDDSDESDEYFPTPPMRPHPGLMEDFFGTGHASYGLRHNLVSPFVAPRFNTPPMARDRHTIYWDYESDHCAAYTEGQCREFRHGLRPSEIVLLLERGAMGSETIRGALRILVSAGNLAEAKQITYPVQIEAALMDTEELMRSLLKRELEIEI